MEYLSSALEFLLVLCGWQGLVVAAILVVSFAVQFYYYAAVYGRIPSYRSTAVDEEGGRPGVSVVVVLMAADHDYIYNVVPALMEQEYESFQLELVDLSGDEDFGGTLAVMAERNPRLSVTSFRPDPKFPISMKMAVNMGVKAAAYDNILLTTTEVVPDSRKWIARMAVGFSDADVVLGYCGVMPENIPGNKIARMDNVAVAMRWLGKAVRGKAYRGTAYNLGFTKNIYFDKGGFNHLNINTGIDDLFVQHLSNGARVSVVLSGSSFVRRSIAPGFGSWYGDRRFSSAAFRFYPSKVKRYVRTELWSRAVFFAATILLLAAFPLEIKIFAAALVLVRLLICLRTVRRVNKRLSEKGLMGMYILYDLLSPIVEAYMAIDRRLRKQPGLWR